MKRQKKKKQLNLEPFIGSTITLLIMFLIYASFSWSSYTSLSHLQHISISGYSIIPEEEHQIQLDPLKGIELEEITWLAKRLNKDEAALAAAGPAIRVTVLSSFLIDYLVEMLPLMFARRGLAATITTGDYGVLAPSLLDKEGVLFTETPDFLILLPSHRDLAHLPAPGCDAQAAEEAVEKEIALWTDLWA